MNKDQNHIDDLISRSLAGEASAEEEKQLTAWIAQQGENNQHYQKFKQAFDLVGKYFANKVSKEPDLNIDQEWNHFLSQVTKKKTENVRFLEPERNSFLLWARVAAAVLLLLASGFIINYFVSNNNDTQFQTADNTLEISLPDGSRIALNRNSELSYAADFGKTSRTVTLTGEAFFEVERDPQKPFIIHINKATIEVLGTSFNVQGYNNRNELEVVVETGTVKFSVSEANKNVLLKAGDRGVFEKQSKELVSTTNTDLNYLSWKTRKIVFMENDLRSVVNALNKIYNANITIAAQVPETCVVTVTFDQQSLEAVLNVLKTTLNLTYTVKDGQIEITDADC